MATIQPKTGVISSYRNQGLGWFTILCELIDNAFDAGAKRVSIEFDRQSLRVTDDGAGCQDLLKILTLGDRQQQATTLLGRYGIGAKDAAISAADGISIRSIHRGIDRAVSCNWKMLEKSDHWEIDDPEESATDLPSGTVIELMPLRMKKVGDHAGLIRRLSRTYTLAIRKGRQIVIQFSRNRQPQVIPEFRTPELEHQITADLSVSGKSARVIMGLIPDGNVVESGGVTISSGYRVIIDGERIGLGEDPTPSLYAWVELGEGWDLTKNKDDLVDREPLGEAIYANCREVIDLAAKRAASVVFDSVGNEVSAAIGSVISDLSTDRKEKRNSTRQSKGTVEPKGTEKRRRRAKQSQDGTGLDGAGKESGAIKVAFRSLGKEGPASQKEGDIVYLNRDIPIVAEKMNDKDSLSVHAIYAAAAHLSINRQIALPGMEDAGSTAKKISQWAGLLLSKLYRSRNTGSEQPNTIRA